MPLTSASFCVPSAFLVLLIKAAWFYKPCGLRTSNLEMILDLYSFFFSLESLGDLHTTYRGHRFEKTENLY